MSKPLQVGVTGGIGSGKSVVCQLFKCFDIPVYEADARAKWLTNNDPEIRSAVISLLGKKAYSASGLYDTTYVSSKVFNNPELLKSLNAIIHPAVGRDTAEWVAQQGNVPYVIKEAAIMNRAGENNTLDFVIVVDAPETLRISRILKRDQRSVDEIRAIIQRQVSDGTRRQLADFIILNDEKSELIPQVKQLHEHFVVLSQSRR